MPATTKNKNVAARTFRAHTLHAIVPHPSKAVAPLEMWK
jgi:hypothetical protein